MRVSVRRSDGAVAVGFRCIAVNCISNGLPDRYSELSTMGWSGDRQHGFDTIFQMITVQPTCLSPRGPLFRLCSFPFLCLVPKIENGKTLEQPHSHTHTAKRPASTSSASYSFHFWYSHIAFLAYRQKLNSRHYAHRKWWKFISNEGMYVKLSICM